MAMEYTARRLHDLTVAGTLELLRLTATLRVGCQLLHMSKDALDNIRGGSGTLQGNVVGDRIQIAQSGL